MTLRETDRITDAQHPHDVIRADVRSEDRTRDAPPGNGTAREKILFGRICAGFVFTVTRGQQADAHHEPEGQREDQ